MRCAVCGRRFGALLGVAGVGNFGGRIASEPVPSLASAHVDPTTKEKCRGSLTWLVDACEDSSRTEEGT